MHNYHVLIASEIHRGTEDQDSQTNQPITDFIPNLHNVAYRNKSPHRCREFLHPPPQKQGETFTDRGTI